MAPWSKFAMAAFLFTSSCNSNEKVAASSNESTSRDTVLSVSPVATDTISPGCYSLVHARDTSSLRLENTRGTVTGALSYNLFEKDRNNGTIQGEVVGDTLRGWYLFKSEGIMSVRQVQWKIKESSLWPAIGEMTERNDTMRFVNPSALRFDSSQVFRKIDCVL